MSHAVYTLVHVVNLEKYWPRVAPWIIQSLGETNDWTDINRIKQMIEEQYAHLWLGTIENETLFAMVTHPMHMGHAPSLIVRWLGGRNPDLWLNDIDQLEEWAGKHGFAKLEIWGRKGWQKLLQPHGFRYDYSVMSKPIKRGVH